jgi:hypothetical protein
MTVTAGRGKSTCLMSRLGIYSGKSPLSISGDLSKSSSLSLSCASPLNGRSKTSALTSLLMESPQNAGEQVVQLQWLSEFSLPLGSPLWFLPRLFHQEYFSPFLPPIPQALCREPVHSCGPGRQKAEALIKTKSPPSLYFQSLGAETQVFPSLSPLAHCEVERNLQSCESQNAASGFRCPEHWDAGLSGFLLDPVTERIDSLISVALVMDLLCIWCLQYLLDGMKMTFRVHVDWDS